MNHSHIRYCLYLFLLLMPSVSNAESLAAATADWSPFAMAGKDGKLEGISVDIFRAIIDRTHNSTSIVLVPPKRLNLLFDQNKIDVNFADSPSWNPTTPNPPYVFSEPYTVVSEYIYFVGDNFQIIQEPVDLIGKIVGINFGYYYAQFETLFSEGSIRVSKTHSPKKLLLNLNNKQIDAAFFDDMSFGYLINQEQLDRSEFRRGKKLTEAPLGLKLRIDKKHLLEKINKVIANMKEDGTIKRIIASYTRPPRL